MVSPLCWKGLSIATKKKLPNVKNPFGSISTATVASIGALHTLQYLLQNSCKKHKDTCRTAAENGHLTCLKFAHEQGCELNKTVHHAAASRGHMNCLKYTTEHGFSLDADTACAAAEGGQLECLQYILRELVLPAKRIFYAAAKGGNVECLEFLRVHGVTAWDVISLRNAAGNGHLACVRYLLDNECRPDYTVTRKVAENGHVECLELLLNQTSVSVYCREEALDSAATHGQISCIKLLKEFDVLHTKFWKPCGTAIYVRSLFECGYPIHKTVLSVAIREGHEDAVEFICANKLCDLCADLTFQPFNARLARKLPILKILHRYGCPWDPRVCLQAAKIGDMESLRFAHRNGCPWHESTTAAPIQICRRDSEVDTPVMQCLQYAIRHGCPCSGDACKMAAARGLLYKLKFFHKHGCPLTVATCVAAARHKYCECFSYAVRHGAPINELDYAAAAVTLADPVGSSPSSHDGEKEIPTTPLMMLKYVHKLGCPWDARTCALAASNAHGLECIKYAHRRGCEWNARSTAAALLGGQGDTLNYLLTHGCPPSIQLSYFAASVGCITSLRKMYDYGAPWNEQVSTAAAASGNADVLRFCVENGCPISKETMEVYNNIQGRVDDFKSVDNIAG